MSRASGPGFVAGALVGGIVGATLALLVAPKPGEQVRRELAAYRRSTADPWVAPGTSPSAVALGALAAAQERLERALVEARRAAEEARVGLTAEWEARKAGRE